MRDEAVAGLSRAIIGRLDRHKDHIRKNSAMLARLDVGIKLSDGVQIDIQHIVPVKACKVLTHLVCDFKTQDTDLSTLFSLKSFLPRCAKVKGRA